MEEKSAALSHGVGGELRQTAGLGNESLVKMCPLILLHIPRIIPCF